jgi:hypothetical protein
MWHQASLAFLIVLLSCQSRPSADLVGAVYYESWVFVGRDSQQNPLLVSLSVRKSQQDKKKVEFESKLFMSKAGETRLVFREKKSVEGNLREVSSDSPISLQKVPCNQETCLLAEISRAFSLRIESDPLPSLTPHAWHDTRIGDAITTATLSLNQEEARGCLVVERGFSLTKPPEPFFGDFDWVALLDEKGDCWLVSEGSRVGGFALSKTGAFSDKVERQKAQVFLDNKSGQEVPAAWSFSVPTFSLTTSLSALSGHRGEGRRLPSGKSAFFGQGVVEGSLQVKDERRQCIGWIQHIKDE